MIFVPGHSLGEVSIGETESSLRQKQFTPDEDRASTAEVSYLRKNTLLVRLVGGRAEQIWFEGKDLGILKLRGQNLPSELSLATSKKFFRDCEPVVSGSGGSLIYCEKRGIEISYGMQNEFEGFSVIALSVAEDVKASKPK